MYQANRSVADWLREIDEVSGLSTSPNHMDEVTENMEMTMRPDSIPMQRFINKMNSLIPALAMVRTIGRSTPTAEVEILWDHLMQEACEEMLLNPMFRAMALACSTPATSPGELLPFAKGFVQCSVSQYERRIFGTRDPVPPPPETADIHDATPDIHERMARRRVTPFLAGLSNSRIRPTTPKETHDEPRNPPSGKFFIPDSEMGYQMAMPTRQAAHARDLAEHERIQKAVHTAEQNVRRKIWASFKECAEDMSMPPYTGQSSCPYCG